jgi:transposase-like protein
MARHSLHTRARVARLLREGKSYSRVERETGVNKSTIVRWMKEPDFLVLVSGQGVLTLGHVQVRAAGSDVLEQAPSEESWVWLGAWFAAR